MTSTEQIEVVRKAYADFSRGDVPAILAALDENVVWTAVGPPADAAAGVWKGHAGVAQFFANVSTTWEMQAFEPRNFIASDNRVAAVGSYRMKSLATGKVGGCDWVMVWTFANGKVISFQEFADTAAVAEILTPASAGAIA